jgi:hypothetical protein
MSEEIQVPTPGQFCNRHFSWLCQAGQGECQRSDDAGDETFDPDQLIGPDDILPHGGAR